MIDRETELFYTTRAEEWASHLPHAVAPQLDAFLDRLLPAARILELGCGDGRDAEQMLARGFDVDATDGTARMVELASARLDRPVRQLRFGELASVAEYDAVYAYASLLHIPASDLPDAVARIHRALKPGGWHFAAMKGGDGGGRDQFGRFYSYIPEADLRAAYETQDWAQFILSGEMGGSFGGGPTPWHFVTVQKGDVA